MVRVSVLRGVERVVVEECHPGCTEGVGQAKVFVCEVGMRE
jgi:hypothetical protein